MCRDIGRLDVGALPLLGEGPACYNCARRAGHLARTCPHGAAAAVPVVALVGGDRRVDFRSFARALGVPRKHVRIATAAECIYIFGFAPGALPPCGHRQPFATFLDAALSSSSSGSGPPGAAAFDASLM